MLYASAVLGPEHVALERYPGDAHSQVYKERLYASTLWLADIFAEQGPQAP